jgi:DNA replication protein DnaC
LPAYRGKKEKGKYNMGNFYDAVPPNIIQGIARRGFATRDEALIECENCGEVEPYHVKLTGRWLKGTCACQIAERERQERAKIRMAWITSQGRQNFDWLRPEPSDSALMEKTFDNFEYARQPLAFDTVQFFLSKSPLTGSLILYSEGYGTGKTHLLAAIVNTLRVNGIAARFATAPKLFIAIQGRMDRNEEYQSILRKAIHTPMLILDDVDKAKPTEWKQDIYFHIINERVNRGLPIAISTNRVADLYIYVGGAACSRLSINQLEAQMEGIDYRTLL